MLQDTCGGRVVSREEIYVGEKAARWYRSEVVLALVTGSGSCGASLRHTPRHFLLVAAQAAGLIVVLSHQQYSFLLSSPLSHCHHYLTSLQLNSVLSPSTVSTPVTASSSSVVMASLSSSALPRPTALPCRGRSPPSSYGPRPGAV